MRRPILVINDDPHVLGVLDATLGAAGFDVRTARDGVEGMQTLLRHAPCWVLLDLDMPVMNGFEFLGGLRRVPFPPRVFVTADSDDPRAIERACRLGAEHAFPREQVTAPGFGQALRAALGLPPVDPPLADRCAA
jgi:CheY-like chemotaxis protein